MAAVVIDSLPVNLAKPNPIGLMSALFACKTRVVPRAAGRSRRDVAGDSDVHDTIVGPGRAKRRSSAAGI
jgi:hypothetical protein